ncbi:unnamed protein product [Onchocerca flexuosa]|uniref:Secreted protein n=1 Tax=Onchocerca flexuosa TaxID=387005 RepID=A0A183HII2_9BILA|nr:unnamed protein product [Onchocerca flexuosa]
MSNLNLKLDMVVQPLMPIIMSLLTMSLTSLLPRNQQKLLQHQSFRNQQKQVLKAMIMRKIRFSGQEILKWMILHAMIQF